MSEEGTESGKIQPRLKLKYLSEIRPALQKELGVKNIHMTPSLVKIVVNMGAGDAARDSKVMTEVVQELSLICGQKPRINRARKSIAQFKLREGQAIGASATLRGDRMWEFLDRTLNLSLPRIRDFRGLSPKQFDGNGNYTFGLNEQVMFHEINLDDVSSPHGMDITIVTTARDDTQGLALLRAFGFPFHSR